jgi:ATP-dependent RNA helicase DeaD
MIKNNLINIIEQGKCADYQKIVTDLAEQYDTTDIAAAALKLFQEGIKPASPSQEKAMFSNTGGAPGMVRLFINIGKAQKIRPEDIIRTIASETDIPGSMIGIINIYEKFSFVEVSESAAERVISVMHKNSIKGYKINVEPAKAR